MDPRWAASIRVNLYELRSHVAKAARACMASGRFWDGEGSAKASEWLQNTAKLLPALRPHVAELLLKEIFQPLVRVPPMLNDPRIASVSN